MNRFYVLILSLALVACGDSVGKNQKNGKNPPANNGANNGGGGSCGDGALDAGEICDNAIADGEEGACPTSCAAPACSTATLIGSAAQCDAVCDVQPIACMNGDGCCPVGCDENSDDDCSNVCGDGATEAPELCDGDCPTSCDDGDACSMSTLTGDPTTCSSSCNTTVTTACVDGDGCCPDGCADQDNDCVVAPMCGDGVLNPGELCDGDCPTSCDDGAACTVDTLVGDANNCDARCLVEDITMCISGDGCCPTNCSFEVDNDCNCPPKTCAQQGIECGPANDTCGMSLNCGGCPNGETCNGGTCVGAPTGNVGSACTSNSQCSSGNCDLAAPGGYCLGETCTIIVGGCAMGEACKADLINMDPNGICIAGCTTANDCRPGYVCETVDLLGATMGCVFVP